MSAASVRSTVASEGITCCSSRRSEPRSPLPGGWAAAQARTRTLAVLARQCPPRWRMNATNSLRPKYSAQSSAVAWYLSSRTVGSAEGGGAGGVRRPWISTKLQQKLDHPRPVLGGGVVDRRAAVLIARHTLRQQRWLVRDHGADIVDPIERN